MADEMRATRETETRETTTRRKVWQPAQTLPVPNPQRGYVFHWVRTAFMGKSDPTNLSSKLREGWEMCLASEHPELRLFLNPDPNSPFKDNVEVGGLILCKAPKELMDQRDAYYAHQTKAQSDSVDNSFMKENDARMPLFSEKRSKVTFGTGK